MLRKGHIEADGLVCALRSERLCQAELENGHKLWAWLPRRTGAAVNWRVGDRVRVEVSVCDLTRGRIVKPPQNDGE